MSESLDFLKRKRLVKKVPLGLSKEHIEEMAIFCKFATISRSSAEKALNDSGWKVTGTEMEILFEKADLKDISMINFETFIGLIDIKPKRAERNIRYDIDNKQWENGRTSSKKVESGVKKVFLERAERPISKVDIKLETDGETRFDDDGFIYFFMFLILFLGIFIIKNSAA